MRLSIRARSVCTNDPSTTLPTHEKNNSTINLLTLLPVCWHCHTKWCRTGVIVKSKVRSVGLGFIWVYVCGGDLSSYHHYPSITNRNTLALLAHPPTSNTNQTNHTPQKQAHDQYLLTASEGDRLPSVTTPDNVTLFLRKHVRA